MRLWSSSADFSGVRERRRTASPGNGRRIRAPAVRRRAAQPRVVRERPASRQIHEAEPSRVVVGDDRIHYRDEHDVVVLRVLRPLVMEVARRSRLLDPEGARHAEVRDQGLASVELEEEVFGPPAHIDDPPAAQPVLERGGETGTGCRGAAIRLCRRGRQASMGMRPRRTVSTSGSSGMHAVADHGEKG